MLISVNGTVIDTKNIYAIHPIVVSDTSHIHFEFTIEFEKNLNLKECVILSSKCYYSRTSNNICITREGKDFWTKGSREDLISFPEYQDALKKITKFRDSIVKIWQENQSEIPQFNL